MASGCTPKKCGPNGSYHSARSALSPLHYKPSSPMHSAECSLPLQLTYIAINLAISCDYLRRISVLCLYFNFSGTHRCRRLYYQCTVLIVVSSTTILFIAIFGCSPISDAWNHYPTKSSDCITTPAFYYTASAIGILTDIVLITPPIKSFILLSLPLIQRLGLCMMFTMGFLFVHPFFPSTPIATALI